MKLGFDVDGIVADLPQLMVEYINEKYNLNHDVSIFASHDVTQNKYVEDDELSTQISLDMLENVVRNDGAMSITKPYKDGVAAIRKLAKHHTLHFITARPGSMKKSTVDWFRNCNIPFTTIHALGGDKPGECVVSKGRLGRSLNLDFYMDDSLCHLEDMYKYKNRWRKGVALFTRPWNVDELLDTDKFIRFDKWTEIIRHLGIHKR